MKSSNVFLFPPSAQIQAAALEAGVPVSKVRPSVGEGDGEVISEDEDLGRTLKMAPKTRGKSARSASVKLGSVTDQAREKSARNRKAGSMKK